MSTSSSDSQQEHPSTYFVQDRSNLDERTRVALQDQMITTGQGGVLPEQPDPTIFQHVLDVGCGAGGWLLEAAQAYPTMTALIGVDVSATMIEAARKEAESRQVSERVQFQTMDALRMLEFPEMSFDLVNQRLGTSWLRTWNWPRLLLEYQRVCRPGGVIRITEAAFITESSSPALIRIYDITRKTLFAAGHLFNDDMAGVSDEVATLLDRHGFEHVQTRPHTLEFRANTESGQLFMLDMTHVFQTALPFYRKWGQAPDDYEQICQQAILEMQQPDFSATWKMVTTWGNNPQV